MVDPLCSGVAEPNTDKLPNKNPLFMIEEEQREHIAKLNKMEREMEEVSTLLAHAQIYFSGIERTARELRVRLHV